MSKTLKLQIIRLWWILNMYFHVYNTKGPIPKYLNANSVALIYN